MVDWIPPARTSISAEEATKGRTCMYDSRLGMKKANGVNQHLAQRRLQGLKRKLPAWLKL